MKMVHSTQLLTAALAALLSGAYAQDRIGCFSRIGPTQYYMTPEGECCSPQFAVVEKDDRGQLVDIRCGKEHGSAPWESLESVPGCLRFQFAPTCTNGFRASLDDLPQPGRCGAEKEAPVAGNPPNNDVGCYSGRIYVNRGECCSTDYVVADGKGIHCNATVPRDANNYPIPPGLDNVPSAVLKDVPKCAGTISKDWCPNGVRSSHLAADRAELCTGTGCCEDWHSRDENGVCQRFRGTIWHLRKFYLERKKDGCELPKKNPGPRCCPNPKEFINAFDECSEFKSDGTRPGDYWLYQWRNEDDGCMDYLDGLEGNGTSTSK